MYFVKCVNILENKPSIRTEHSDLFEFRPTIQPYFPRSFVVYPLIISICEDSFKDLVPKMFWSISSRASSFFHARTFGGILPWPVHWMAVHAPGMLSTITSEQDMVTSTIE